MIWRSFFWQKWLTICICWYSNHPVSENFEPYWNMNLQAKSRYVSGFQEPKARHLMMPGGWFRIKSFIRVPCICLNISWLLRTCSRDFYKTKILDLLAGCLEKVPKTCSQMVPWWWFTIVQSKTITLKKNQENSWLNVLATAKLLSFSFLHEKSLVAPRGVCPRSQLYEAKHAGHAIAKTIGKILPSRQWW